MESSQKPDLFGDVRAEPAAPAAPYLGGKKNLARRLVPLIDSARARVYAEPFVGMGGVFLRRRYRAPVEIINDISADVTTFFRILQRHYVPFVEMLRWQLTTRADFERLMATPAETCTDLELAARFFYLQTCSFGGKVAGRSFALDIYQGGAFNLLTLVPRLEAVHARLAGVTIERMPFQDFIPRIDAPDALFYLDPPYWGGETDYGPGVFAREDFARLAEILQGIEGRFILSINDRPEIRELFGWADLTPVGVTYSIGDNSHQASELIIRGGGGG